MTTPTIDDTIAFIKRAHEGQVTKSGEPYWTHPIAVMHLLPWDATDDERHAALLHDVMEDCGVTAADLSSAGYSDATVAIVLLVTRPNTDRRPTYMNWIRSIVASGNRSAIRVKLADIQHNSDPERIATLPIEDRDIARRYERARRVLEGAA